MKWIPALDGGRGVAVLRVIFLRLGYLDPGWVGVRIVWRHSLLNVLSVPGIDFVLQRPADLQRLKPQQLIRDGRVSGGVHVHHLPILLTVLVRADRAGTRRFPVAPANFSVVCLTLVGHSSKATFRDLEKPFLNLTDLFNGRDSLERGRHLANPAKVRRVSGRLWP